MLQDASSQKNYKVAKTSQLVSSGVRKTFVFGLCNPPFSFLTKKT